MKLYYTNASHHYKYTRLTHTNPVQNKIHELLRFHIIYIYIFY